MLVDSKYGTLVRTAPRRKQNATRSEGQRTGEARMARASRAFGLLERDEALAWSRYGETLAEPHPRTGVVATLSGQQAFCRLANKLLQIDPQASLPTEPPSAPFFGDGVRVTASEPLPMGSGRGGDSNSGVLFRADAANRQGILTELLLQMLASRNRRTYLERYRTQAFVAFAPDALVRLVPAKPGWQAAAVRFVEASTGRSGALVEIGVVRVD